MIRRRWLVAVLASAVWTTWAAEDKVAGGPFVVNVGPKTATVVWLVEGSEVKLGTARDQLTKAALSGSTVLDLAAFKAAFPGPEAAFETAHRARFGFVDERHARDVSSTRCASTAPATIRASWSGRSRRAAVSSS